LTANGLYESIKEAPGHFSSLRGAGRGSFPLKYSLWRAWPEWQNLSPVGLHSHPL